MKKITALLTLALAIAFAISPAFTTPFSGFSENQLPIPQIDPPIQPEGYAFAIWGLIYAWLTISTLYGLWKRAEDDDWQTARLPLVISLGVGVPWLAIANASAIWATVAIIIMAIGAIISLIRAPKRDRWLFQAPTAIYAGWLTAASWVSIATTSAGYGIVMGSFGWAIAGIIGALITALTIFNMRKTAPEYLATVIWALVGIVVANGTALLTISILAAAGIAALLTAILTLRTPQAA
jgi:hypothetical protein